MASLSDNGDSRNLAAAMSYLRAILNHNALNNIAKLARLANRSING